MRTILIPARWIIRPDLAPKFSQIRLVLGLFCPLLEFAPDLILQLLQIRLGTGFYFLSELYFLQPDSIFRITGISGSLGWIEYAGFSGYSEYLLWGVPRFPLSDIFCDSIHYPTSIQPPATGGSLVGGLAQGYYRDNQNIKKI